MRETESSFDDDIENSHEDPQGEEDTNGGTSRDREKIPLRATPGPFQDPSVASQQPKRKKLDIEKQIHEFLSTKDRHLSHTELLKMTSKRVKRWEQQSIEVASGYSTTLINPAY